MCDHGQRTSSTPITTHAPLSPVPGAGPAGPVLTPSEWAHVEALCLVNANRANAAIREKIRIYFAARELAASKDDEIGRQPARGARVLAGSRRPWHPHPFRPHIDRPHGCTICGGLEDAPHHQSLSLV